MKKILVPTDFSSTAIKAFSYAAGIGQKTGATIFLLHVIEPVVETIRQPFPLKETLQDEITRNRWAELDKMKNAIAKVHPKLKIEIELTTGKVTKSINDFAQKKKVDLIVMGTTGASGLKKLFIGSITAGTIVKSKLPVLTVPCGYKLEEPDGILFATNRFEENKNMLEPIVKLARLYDATIHITVFIDKDGAKAEEYIYNSRQLLYYNNLLWNMFPDIKFTTELLDGSDFELTIDTYNNKNELDIIAMISYPKSFWEKALNKSMTKRMAFHSTVPLLVIPAK